MPPGFRRRRPRDRRARRRRRTPGVRKATSRLPSARPRDSISGAARTIHAHVQRHVRPRRPRQHPSKSGVVLHYWKPGGTTRKPVNRPANRASDAVGSRSLPGYQDGSMFVILPRLGSEHSVRIAGLVAAAAGDGENPLRSPQVMYGNEHARVAAHAGSEKRPFQFGQPTARNRYSLDRAFKRKGAVTQARKKAPTRRQPLYCGANRASAADVTPSGDCPSGKRIPQAHRPSLFIRSGPRVTENSRGNGCRLRSQQVVCRRTAIGSEQVTQAALRGFSLYRSSGQVERCIRHFLNRGTWCCRSVKVFHTSRPAVPDRGREIGLGPTGGRSRRY